MSNKTRKVVSLTAFFSICAMLIVVWVGVRLNSFSANNQQVMPTPTVAAIVNPLNVQPQAETAPVVPSYQAQQPPADGEILTLEEARVQSAAKLQQDGQIILSPQTGNAQGALIEASTAPVPAQAEQAAVAQAPVAQSGTVVVQPMAPVVANPKYVVSQVETVSGWTLTWTQVGEKDRGDGKSYRQFTKETYPAWTAFNPSLWPLAPNVPNPLDSTFRVIQGQLGPEVPDGVEIPGVGIQNFCESVPDPVSKEFISVDCRVVVPPGHYVILSGDGEIPGIWSSAAGYGNTVIFWNVGNVEGSFIGKFRQVWYLKGRFWNGDTLPVAIAALSGHVANNMLDLKSPLNPTGTVNAGGNCSVREGCSKVFVTDIVHSGDAPMLIATNSAIKQ